MLQDGPVDFVAPIEDPDCPVCRLSEAERLLLLFSARDHGSAKLIDEHGVSHHLVLKAEGNGGVVEALAMMRKLVKDKERQD